MTTPLVDLARVERRLKEAQQQVGQMNPNSVTEYWRAHYEIDVAWLLQEVARLAEALEEEKTLRAKEHIDLYNKYAGESQARFTADREIARLRAALEKVAMTRGTWRGDLPNREGNVLIGYFITKEDMADVRAALAPRPTPETTP